MIQHKSMPLDLKDLDKTKRTAVIAHAAYNNIDRTKDISRKGMFSKSWAESKGDIAFYLNHNDTQAPGKVMDVSEDSEKAYTHVWLGNHSLGNDVLTMMDEGVIKNASFGYYTVKSNPIEVKGQKVRELKEVAHIETSVLTKMPANPSAGVISVVKSFDIPEFDVKTLSNDEQAWLRSIIGYGNQALVDACSLAASLSPDSDLYSYINYYISRISDMTGSFKDRLSWGVKEVADMRLQLKTLESFVRNTKASDTAIELVQGEIHTIKSLLSAVDTVATRQYNEPAASDNGEDVRLALELLKLKASA